MGLDVDGEVELHVPLLLAVHPLDPPSGLLDLYAGGVDCDGDGVVRLPEHTVGVDVQVEDAFPPKPGASSLTTLRRPMTTDSRLHLSRCMLLEVYRSLNQ